MTTTTRTREAIADDFWRARLAHDDEAAERYSRELDALIAAETAEAAAGLPDECARIVHTFAMRRDGDRWAGFWTHPERDGFEFWHVFTGRGWSDASNLTPHRVAVRRGIDGTTWTLEYCEGDVFLSRETG